MLEKLIGLCLIVAIFFCQCTTSLFIALLYLHVHSICTSVDVQRDQKQKKQDKTNPKKNFLKFLLPSNCCWLINCDPCKKSQVFGKIKLYIIHIFSNILTWILHTLCTYILTNACQYSAHCKKMVFCWCFFRKSIIQLD